MYSLTQLYKMTYLYLLLPLFLFLTTWLDCGWAIIFGGIWAYCGYQTCRLVQKNDFTYGNRKVFLIALIFAVIWCFCAGIGYFYYQSFDYHFRNAVFRDLINNSWPVFYDKADTPMVYYMAFWLPAALIGKVLSIFPLTQSSIFMTANIFLFIYAVCGLGLILLHIFAAAKVKSTKQALFSALFFLLFSGADIIGYTYFKTGEQPFALHLEWWSGILQYSSMTTFLFWVFNQFIPIALITLMIYNERNIKNFGVLITAALFFSPYPTLGGGILAIVYAGYCFMRTDDKLSFLRNDIFSKQNMLAVFLILPLIILYFSTNSGGITKFYFLTDFASWKQYFRFIGCEVLIYILILLPFFRKNIFFGTVAVSLLLFPLLRTDMQNNFCMRASLPALILLAVFVLKFISENIYRRKNYLAVGAILLVFLFGCATPITEFRRGIHYVTEAQKLNLTADGIYTLNQKYVDMPVFHFRANHQFTAEHYKTDIFWNFFATQR